MKIKIIDLLIKIVNGEEVPKKIKYDRDTFMFDEERKDYVHQIDEDGWWSETLLFKIKDINFIKEFLETKVEIIEENKPIEELETEMAGEQIRLIGTNETRYSVRVIDGILISKINELVKEINKLKEK